MAKRKHSELAAGAFVLIALAAGVGVLIWLGAADVLLQRGQRVVFFVPQEQGKLGLEIGSIVKVNDAPVGRIRAIRFDPGSVRTLYETRLERTDIRVHADARAEAVVEFIGGASVILADFGTDKAPLAGESNPVPLTEGASSMFRQAQNVLGYAEPQRKQFRQALADVAAAAENAREITGAILREVDASSAAALLAGVKHAVDNLRASSTNLLHMSEKLRAEADRAKAGSLLLKIHGIADYVTELSENAAEMMKKVRPQAEHIVAKVREYTDRDVATVLANLRTASNRLVEIVGDIQTLTAVAKDSVVLNRDTIDEFVLNMNAMAENLAAAAREIRRNPWRLLQKPKDKEVESENIYDAARAFAEGASRLDGALIRLAALRAARPDGVRAGDPELKKILDYLKGTFEKFRAAEDALWRELAE